MENLLIVLKATAAVLGIFAIVPLCVWAGSGSARVAWQACKQYLFIMGLLALAGGGVGLLIAVIERIG